ncbi:MAG: GGDEF domain-containing protein [Thiotrichales bacterium]|nr:GGDEF domain-containing protein [Thiotrichales bacterium]
MTDQNKSVFNRYTQNKKEARALAEGCLEKLKQLELNANPIHFTLLFEWLSQNDPFLHTEIEQALNDNSYNNNTAETLFINLIGQILYSSIPSQEVENLLKNLQSQLDSWTNSSDKKHSELTKHINEIKALELPTEIQKPLTEQILPTIESMMQETKHLKDQVLKAGQEIRLLKKELERASSISKIDELTNIANRNGFNEILNKTVKQANSEQSSFALILIDMDNFADINETYGYLIGDSVLRYTAKLIGNEVGLKGSYARFDGQQFIISIPNCYYDDAMKVANTIRSKISARPLQIKSNQKTLTLSISAAVSLYQMGENIEALLDRVMSQLKEAKNSGRNRVIGNA